MRGAHLDWCVVDKDCSAFDAEVRHESPLATFVLLFGLHTGVMKSGIGLPRLMSGIGTRWVRW